LKEEQQKTLKEKQLEEQKREQIRVGQYREQLNENHSNDANG
jgi:hypothetical protein